MNILLSPMVALSATMVLAFTFIVGAASAQPQVIYSGNTATRIVDLIVDGNSYQVDFVNESANSLYGTPPVFDFDEAGATAATEAIRTALNDVPAVTRVGPADSFRFRVGYSVGLAGLIVSVKSDYADTWREGDVQLDAPDDVRSYAKFSPSTPTVPNVWGHVKSLYR